MFDLPATDRPVESGTLNQKIRVPETDSKKTSENLPFQKGHEIIYSNKIQFQVPTAAVSFRQGCSNSLQCLPRFVATNVKNQREGLGWESEGLGWDPLHKM